MNALCKSLHYYDVLKPAQEDTILESDLSVEDCDSRLAPTSEVGCYARPHLKSHAVQTHFIRRNKNFRNECTATSDGDISLLDSPFNRDTYSVYSGHSWPITGSPHSQQYPLLGRKTVVIAQHTAGSMECCHCKKTLSVPQTTIIPKKVGNDKSTQFECLKCKMSICNCDEYRYIPCNIGLAARRNFTLGTAESRRWQNEHCKTKLIGGCRVPVSKNYKSRF